MAKRRLLRSYLIIIPLILSMIVPFLLSVDIYATSKQYPSPSSKWSLIPSPMLSPTPPTPVPRFYMTCAPLTYNGQDYDFDPNTLGYDACLYINNRWINSLIVTADVDIITKATEPTYLATANGSNNWGVALVHLDGGNHYVTLYFRDSDFTNSTDFTSYVEELTNVSLTTDYFCKSIWVGNGPTSNYTWANPDGLSVVSGFTNPPVFDTGTYVKFFLSCSPLTYNGHDYDFNPTINKGNACFCVNDYSSNAKIITKAVEPVYLSSATGLNNWGVCLMHCSGGGNTIYMTIYFKDSDFADASALEFWVQYQIIPGETVVSDYLRKSVLVGNGPDANYTWADPDNVSVVNYTFPPTFSADGKDTSFYISCAPLAYNGSDYDYDFNTGGNDASIIVNDRNTNDIKLVTPATEPYYLSNADGSENWGVCLMNFFDGTNTNYLTMYFKDGDFADANDLCTWLGNMAGVTFNSDYFCKSIWVGNGPTSNYTWANPDGLSVVSGFTTPPTFDGILATRFYLSCAPLSYNGQEYNNYFGMTPITSASNYVDRASSDIEFITKATEPFCVHDANGSNNFGVALVHFSPNVNTYYLTIYFKDSDFTNASDFESWIDGMWGQPSYAVDYFCKSIWVGNGPDSNYTWANPDNLSLVHFIDPPTLASTSTLPQMFYGTVQVRNYAGGPLVAAPNGTVVSAYVFHRGYVGTINITVVGKYGDTPGKCLTVPGNISDGSLIYFFVNGQQTPQTAVFESGAITELDLTANLYSRGGSGGGGGGGGGYQPPSQSVNLNIIGGSGTGTTDSNGIFQNAVDAASPDGKISIHISSGTAALGQDGSPLTQLSISSVSTYPAPPEGQTVIAAFDFQPNGASFNPAIQITITYDPSTLPAGTDVSQLVIAFYNAATGQWEYVSGTVNPAANTITFSINHFTVFAVMSAPASSAAPTVTPTPSPTPTPTVLPTVTPTTTVLPTLTPTATPTSTVGLNSGNSKPSKWVLVVLDVVGGALLAVLIGAIVKRNRKK